MDDIPNDVNGEALRRMLADGDDLSIPRLFDFEHLFPDEDSAEGFANAAEGLGFSTETWLYEAQASEGAPPRWNVTVNTRMAADYAAITATELELGGLARAFGGHADGWGCVQPDRPTN